MKSFNPEDAGTGVHEWNNFDMHSTGRHAVEQKNPAFLSSAANSHLKKPPKTNHNNKGPLTLTKLS